MEYIREKLHNFLESNPQSAIDQIAVRDGERPGVKRPWGDDSIALLIPDEFEEFAETLNQVILPTRFTAIWHKDTKDFEVIWGAHPLPAKIADVQNRSFEFHFKHAAYRCEFGRSSDRLLAIAVHSRPISATTTGHRNLSSFNTYMKERAARHVSDESTDPSPRLGEPLSFWVRGVNWNEEKVLELVNHLNFYMEYFDNIGPKILVHATKQETAEAAPRDRYVIGKFPEIIIPIEIDDAQMHYWIASRMGDASWRFIQSFRIIEYASSSFLELSARSAVRRILSAPHALSDIQGVTERVLAEVWKAKMGENENYWRVETLIKERMDTDILWREINRNLPAFTTETVFEGGCKLNPLIASNCRAEDFSGGGIVTLVKMFHDIRNNLSHGKERKSSGTITPTFNNFQKLLPWASLISIVASEVIINKDTI